MKLRIKWLKLRINLASRIIKNMNKKTLLYVLGGVLLLWPMVSMAATFIVEEEGVQATTSADIEDDLYIVGNNVSITHDVGEDLFAGANTVVVDGNVGQDLHAGGNTVRVEGAVGDDLFVGGNTVIVMVSTVDDVFIGGQIVEVTGDVIEGSVYVGGQNVNIKGNIKGSVRVRGETIKIKSGTLIEGDLITYGNKEPIIEDDVQINGEKRHSESVAKTANRVESNVVMAWVTSVLVWFIVGLVLVYLLPGLSQDIANMALTKGGKSLGIGFVWLALLIPVIIVLFISMVGWPLAIMVGVFTAGDVIAAIAFGMVVVGVWVMKKMGKEESKITWQHVLLGVVIMKIVSLIPVVGGLIGVVVMLLVLGSIGMVLWERLKKEKLVVSEPTTETK